MSDLRHYRAGRHAYLVLSILFGSFIGISVFGWYYIHASFWKATLLWTGAYVATLAWLRAFRITISDEELVFRSLSGTRRISRDEIGAVRLGFDLSHGGGPLRLFVTGKGRPDDVTMSINAKILSTDTIRAVLAVGGSDPEPDRESVDIEDGIVSGAVRRRRLRSR